MLWYFPDLYDDEIFYSGCARYHYYSGNQSFLDTLNDLFGTRNIIPNIILPSHLKYLTTRLFNSIYTENYIIAKHTILPYFFPFLPSEYVKEIRSRIVTGSISGLYNRMGLAAGEVCKKNALFYCKKCLNEDMESLGEAYFHRLHQVEGVNVCPKHKIRLSMYPLRNNHVSRIEFIRLDSSLIKSETGDINYRMNKVELDYANSVKYLLDSDLSNFSYERISMNYFNLLKCRGYVTLNGSIRKKNLKEDVVAYFGHEVLDMFESEVLTDSYSTWIDKLLDNKTRFMHPIRHILFIMFLYKDFNSFFTDKIRECNPFGEAPWPCLNQVSDHYRQDVVKTCKLSPAKNNSKVVGTFYCGCGFVYSRVGPDYDDSDRYRIGRIKEFGPMWREKLSEYSKSSKVSLRELSRKMHCDPMTVKKYLNNSDINESVRIKVKDTSMKNIYRNNIETYCNENIDVMRSEIKTLFTKEYMWLYKHEKQLLYKILPPHKKSNKISYHVDWEMRDSDTLHELKAIFEELIKNHFVVHITKTQLIRRCDRHSMLEANVNKLLKCKNYLEFRCETNKEYHIRKVKRICRKYLKDKIQIKKWIVYRKAGIRKEYSADVEDLIEHFIQLQRLE